MRVSNEEIDLLPLSQFDKEIVVIDDVDAVPDAIADIRQNLIIGFDTETRPSFKRGVNYPVALLQISTEQKTWLFRLCKIGLPQPIADLFADPSIKKVGLAILDDLRALRKRLPFTPANCIDLQSIAKERGIEDQSLKKMAAQVLGVKVSKRQRLTNWENPILSPSQQTYAATDSWISLLLFNELMRGTVISPKLLEVRNIIEEKQKAKNISPDNNNTTE